MKRGILTLLLISFILPSFSQENILLKGVIKADSLIASGINIINLTQRTGTTNSESGEFLIKVVKNDTLLFSSIQYEPVEVLINTRIINEGFLEVYLIEKINQIGEVHLSNISLTGNLQQDVLQVPTYNQKDFGFPLSTRKPLTPIERKLNSARGSPLITLINTFNGTIAMLQQAKVNEDLSLLVERGMNAFDTSFFERLEIAENQIKNFIYFCTADSNFEHLLEEYNRLKLVEFYQRKAPIFLFEQDLP